MLTPPALSYDTIAAFVRDTYGLRVRQVTFLPLGADANAAVYRVETDQTDQADKTDDGEAYFLKVKRGDFDEIAVAIPAFLHEQGIAQVMAPLPTITHTLWTHAHGYAWILYPFFEGDNGFHRTLSDAQWVALGACLKAIHGASLPARIAAKVPREDYSPRWREVVREYNRQVDTRRFDDPFAQRLAAFWASRREDIHTMVERAELLARELRGRAIPFVLCHTDLHAGNVLLGASDELALTIVDWDAPLFAPKERDLMFVGGGVGAIWDTAREEALFYQGYGATEIDLAALSYYRYERIVEDLAAYGEQIFEAQGSAEDREHGLEGTMGQFLPGRVVAIAHQTYARLA